jgi:hypothetical protein
MVTILYSQLLPRHLRWLGRHGPGCPTCRSHAPYGQHQRERYEIGVWSHYDELSNFLTDSTRGGLGNITNLDLIYLTSILIFMIVMLYDQLRMSVLNRSHAYANATARHTENKVVSSPDCETTIQPPNDGRRLVYANVTVHRLIC